MKNNRILGIEYLGINLLSGVDQDPDSSKGRKYKDRVEISGRKKM